MVVDGWNGCGRAAWSGGAATVMALMTTTTMATVGADPARADGVVDLFSREALAQPTGDAAGDDGEAASESNATLNAAGGGDGDTTFDEAMSREITPFGEAGSWRWAVYGGGAFDLNRDGEHYNLHVGADYFVVDNFSINFELGGLYFAQPDDAEDTVGLNFNILAQWHFLTFDDWSLYVDGGAGLLGTGDDVPPPGTSFNFTPQAGVGASFNLGDEGARGFVGARWHHISNARLNGEDDNPGRDAAMIYAGVSFPID